MFLYIFSDIYTLKINTYNPIKKIQRKSHKKHELSNLDYLKPEL